MRTNLRANIQRAEIVEAKESKAFESRFISANINREGGSGRPWRLQAR